MGGDSIMWLVIIVTILICDGLAVYVYRKRNSLYGHRQSL